MARTCLPAKFYHQGSFLHSVPKACHSCSNFPSCWVIWLLLSTTARVTAFSELSFTTSNHMHVDSLPDCMCHLLELSLSFLHPGCLLLRVPWASESVKREWWVARVWGCTSQAITCLTMSRWARAASVYLQEGGARAPPTAVSC